jgi:hypothetical protein
LKYPKDNSALHANAIPALVALTYKSKGSATWRFVVHHIQLSKDTIHLCKVKAHAGSLGNECANAMAKCSVGNQSGHDIHINTDANPHSSVFWLARVGDPSPACLPDTPAERLSISSDLDAIKAQMHVQHKLGYKSKKVSNHRSTKCYTNTQNTKNWLRKALSRKTLAIHFGKMQVLPMEKRENSCFAAQVWYTTEGVPLSAIK